MIFGRAGEEIAACRAAGIAIEVVPGITAARRGGELAVSTQRHNSSRLQYVTGHGENGRLPADTDWASLDDPTATTVVYMPKKTIGELTTARCERPPGHAGGRGRGRDRVQETMIAGTTWRISP